MSSRDCEDGVKIASSIGEMVSWCLPMAVSFAIGAVFGPSVATGNSGAAVSCVFSLLLLIFVYAVDRRHEIKSAAELGRVNGYMSANVEAWRLRKDNSRDGVADGESGITKE